MSQAAVLRIDEPKADRGPLTDPKAVDFMGPARVLEVAGDRIAARRSDGHEVEVEMALAFAYRPAQGDMLLLVGGELGNYAIGVLQGAGQATLAIPGDVELHALGGELTLRGDQGVRLASPEVSIATDRFKVVADAAVQKLTSFALNVRELWSVKTKKTHIAVDDEIYQRSKSVTMLTEETVVINGKQIHIG